MLFRSYNLRDPEGRIIQYIEELQPRNSCRNYVLSHGGRTALIRKEDFDSHYYEKNFEDGPHREGFGDGEGEPYNPNRQAFGKLKVGTKSEPLVVYCELSPGNSKKADTLLDTLDKSNQTA